MVSKQFKMMIPSDVMDWVSERAKANMRSKSAEINMALKEKMAAEGKIGVQTSAAGNKPEKDC